MDIQKQGYFPNLIDTYLSAELKKRVIERDQLSGDSILSYKSAKSNISKYGKRWI